MPGFASGPRQTVPLFCRTGAGAEVDLLLEIPKHGLWAIEIKRGLSARPEKGSTSPAAISSQRARFVVNSGTERYRVDANTEADRTS